MEELMQTDPVTLSFLFALAWFLWGFLFLMGKFFFWVDEGLEVRALYKRCRLDTVMSLLRAERLMEEIKPTRLNA